MTNYVIRLRASAEWSFCRWYLIEMLSAGCQGPLIQSRCGVLLYFCGWQLVWEKWFRYITSLEHSDNSDSKLPTLKTDVLSPSRWQQVSGSLAENSWVETRVAQDRRTGSLEPQQSQWQRGIMFSRIISTFNWHKFKFMTLAKGKGARGEIAL